MLNIVFFGTPAFSVPALEALTRDPRCSVNLVVSQPPKPVGRDQVVTDSPIAQFAKAHALPLETPLTLRKNQEITERIRSLHPDFLVVVAFGKIIPDELLGVAKFGAVNIHPSALPKYRGASPLQMSIASGDTQTAVSIMLMDAEVDHGPILQQLTDTISEEDTAETLGMRLFEKAARALPNLLVQLSEGTLKPTAQDHAQATFTSLIDRADGKADFSMSARLLDAKRRGFTPWPGMFMELGDGLVVKLLETKPTTACATHHVPGALHMAGETLHAASSEGCLMLTSVQPAGKSPMSGSAFSRGYGRYLSK